MAVCSASAEDLTESDRFAEALAARAASVLSRSGTRQAVFCVGDLWIRIVGSGAALDRLGPAFLSERRLPPSALESAHRLIVWDGTSCDALPPEPPWTAADYSPFGLVQSHSSDAIRFAFDADTSALMACDFASNTSHIWFPSIAKLPAWATAAPFRILIAWLCNVESVQMVHGAAVALDGQAVLLAGKGGSGKSTVALACALAGLDYLGDDYCAVEPAAGKVHLVYRSAKASSSTLEMLPALKPNVAAWDPPPIDKSVIFLDPREVGLVRSAALKAILLPRVDRETATSVRPATRAEALQAILPNTIMQLMGGTSVSARLIMQLVQTVPSFHLSLGTDLRNVTETIAAQLRKEG